MTKIFERQQFRSFYDSGRHVYADLEFRRCRFVSSSISITEDPRRRSIVRNVKLIQCEEIGCTLDTAIVEDVLVDGLKTSDVFQTWGAVFKHVTLRGNIDQVMLSPLVATGLATPAQQQAFDVANAAYYAAVDWALDISEAACEELDIRGIPARLIRRDPRTQVVVTRQKALEGHWRQLDLDDTYGRQHSNIWWIIARIQTSSWWRTRAPDFPQLLRGLELLRDAGVAEPD